MNHELMPLRKEIDSIDTFIIRFIANRLLVAQKIGAIKQRTRLPVEDIGRETEVKSLHRIVAGEQKVPLELVEEVFDALMTACRAVQAGE